jgi:hypothetical protein
LSPARPSRMTPLLAVALLTMKMGNWLQGTSPAML